MEKYYSVLSQCPLFHGINREELFSMLHCLSGRVVEVQKDQAVFTEGDHTEEVGIVLSGSVQLINVDYFGNRTIVTRMEPGQLFGESFAFAGVSEFPLNVVATENSEIMLIKSFCITNRCSNACDFHNKLVYNLLKVVSTQNLHFHEKLEILSKRTTRDKLMTYLHGQAKYHGSNTFTIPFDRQALADYLGVERSAMSAEISKMKKEGLIFCNKSQFTLLS